MLKGKWKLLICIALVTCVLFGTSNSVFAAINEEYYQNNVAGKDVVDANIDDKLLSSSLTDAIGSFIYGIGSLMELVVSYVFKLVTGSSMFPWADAILFNAVPFLDVNIFTASSNSLVSMLYDFLTGMYYSLLTLASSFFGIAVMFSAIKLAVTAIAEDKARYKKAIVDWLLGLVMLWGMHFFISFVLYLNEQFVVIASDMATEELEENGEALYESSHSTAEASVVVENFIKNMKEIGTMNANHSARENFEDLKEDFGESWYSYGECSDSDLTNDENTLKMYPVVAMTLLDSEDFHNYAFQHNVYSKSAWLITFEAKHKSFICALATHVNNVVNMTDSDYNRVIELASMYESGVKSSKKDKEWKDKYVAYLKIIAQAASSYRGLDNEGAFVSSLAEFFKSAAWQRKAGGWKANKIAISNAIMYVIFVCYSVVFFISYTKRLFYVIMLILMAPIVVVFDFFMKFGK